MCRINHLEPSSGITVRCAYGLCMLMIGLAIDEALVDLRWSQSLSLLEMMVNGQLCTNVLVVVSCGPIGSQAMTTRCRCCHWCFVRFLLPRSRLICCLIHIEWRYPLEQAKRSLGLLIVSFVPQTLCIGADHLCSLGQSLRWWGVVRLTWIVGVVGGGL